MVQGRWQLPQAAHSGTRRQSPRGSGSARRLPRAHPGPGCSTVCASRSALAFFHGKRHPAEMGASELTQFLSALAVEGKVAASTQNQALSVLLFL